MSHRIALTIRSRPSLSRTWTGALVGPLTWAACCVVVFLGMSQEADAQMEKRVDALYRQRAFVASRPTLGDQAPELQLKTLQGQSVNLADYYGKPLVVIKGSYT